MYTLQSTQDLYARMRRELPKHYGHAHAMLQMMLGNLWRAEGLNTAENLAQHRVRMSRYVFETITKHEREEDAARAMNRLFCNGTTQVESGLGARSALIRAQVAPHIIGMSILDFGCGDGRVSAEAFNEHIARTQLYDVSDYRHESARVHPFTTKRETITAIFDTAFVVTVLHHCEEPEEELQWLAKHCNRAIIIESVVSNIMPWAVQAFVDWLYNRGFHMDAAGAPAAIPVPGSFHTVDEWKERILDAGFRSITQIIDYGIDQLAAPEHHVLIVADR